MSVVESPVAAPVRPADPAVATTPWSHVAAAVTLLSLVIAVIVTAFVWPASRTAVHDLPLAVAGPPAAVEQVAARLDQARPGAFDVRPVADDAAARAAVREREAYGAIVLRPAGEPVVYTATAASPAVAQVIGEVARAVRGDGPAPVRDLAPTAAEDPRGAGLGSAALPLVLAGIAAAAAATFRIRGGARRVALVGGVAVVGGLAITVVLQLWLGVLDGSFATNAGVVTLGIAAVAAPAAGLAALIGPAGLGLAAAVMVLLGNPLSGLGSAPEMLPEGWGTLGRLLPPGATGSLLRSTAFFDGAAAAAPVAVLGAWVLAGLLFWSAAWSRRVRA